MATELRDFLALSYDQVDRWSQPDFFAQGRIRRNPAVVQSELVLLKEENARLRSMGYGAL